MDETLDYIESYFNNSLTGEERMQFEQRIASDTAFAGEVAFYLQARQELRQEMLAQKAKGWNEPLQTVERDAPSHVIPMTATTAVTQAAENAFSSEEDKKVPVVKINRPPFVRRMIAIAAGVIVTAGISIPLIFNSANSLQRMTAEIINKEVAQKIGGEMGSTESSSKIRAVDAYNTANYTTAATLFDSLQRANPNDVELLEYSGRAALLLENYDTAISRFQKLGSHTEVRNPDNPGKFYEALAIIQRKRQGYKAEANTLLTQVIANKLKGWQQAEELLEKLK